MISHMITWSNLRITWPLKQSYDHIVQSHSSHMITLTSHMITYWPVTWSHWPVTWSHWPVTWPHWPVTWSHWPVTWPHWPVTCPVTWPHWPVTWSYWPMYTQVKLPQHMTVAKFLVLLASQNISLQANSNVMHTLSTALPRNSEDKCVTIPFCLHVPVTPVVLYANVEDNRHVTSHFCVEKLLPESLTHTSM